MSKTALLDCTGGLVFCFVCLFSLSHQSCKCLISLSNYIFGLSLMEMVKWHYHQWTSHKSPAEWKDWELSLWRRYILHSDIFNGEQDGDVLCSSIVALPLTLETPLQLWSHLFHTSVSVSEFAVKLQLMVFECVFRRGMLDTFVDSSTFYVQAMNLKYHKRAAERCGFICLLLCNIQFW